MQTILIAVAILAILMALGYIPLHLKKGKFHAFARKLGAKPSWFQAEGELGQAAYRLDFNPGRRGSPPVLRISLPGSAREFSIRRKDESNRQIKEGLDIADFLRQLETLGDTFYLESVFETREPRNAAARLFGAGCNEVWGGQQWICAKLPEWRPETAEPAPVREIIELLSVIRHRIN